MGELDVTLVIFEDKVAAKLKYQVLVDWSRQSIV